MTETNTDENPILLAADAFETYEEKHKHFFDPEKVHDKQGRQDKLGECRGCQGKLGTRHYCEFGHCRKEVCGQCCEVLPCVGEINVCRSCSLQVEEGKNNMPEEAPRKTMKTKQKRSLGASITRMLRYTAVALTALTHPTITESASLVSGVDFKELYAGSACVSRQGLEAGATIGTPVDYLTGYNLAFPDQRDAVELEIKRDQPYCLVWENECTNRSVASARSMDPTVREWLQSATRPELEWTAKLCRSQAKGRRTFLLENPKTSEIWQEECVRSLADIPGTQIIELDMCRAGMKDLENGKPVRKPTWILTNLPSVRNLTDKTCLGDHEHSYLEGRYSKELGHTHRTRMAAEYPKLFGQWVAKDILASRNLSLEQQDLLAEGIEMEEDLCWLNQEEMKIEAACNAAKDDSCPACRVPPLHRAHTRRGDCRYSPIQQPAGLLQPSAMQPTLERKQWTNRRRITKKTPISKLRYSMKKDPRGLEGPRPNVDIPPVWRAALQKLHVQFAHPSGDQLARILQKAQAPDKVVTAAKGWKCSACDAQKRARAQKKVSIPKATMPNQGIGLDTMFITDRRGGREVQWAVINIICLATTFHRGYAYELEKGESVTGEMVHKSLDRWITAHGAPDFMVTDEGGESLVEKVEKLCTFHEIEHRPIAAAAPWQNSTVKRHGGALKSIIYKLLGDSVLPLDILTNQATIGKNSLLKKHHHSADEWFLGRCRKVPLDSFGGEEDNAAGAELAADPDERYHAIHDVAWKARAGFEEYRARESISRAIKGRNRPSRGPWCIGETCYYWKKIKKPIRGDQQTIAKKGGWYGKAVVTMVTPSVIWVTHGKRLLRVPM